MKLTRKQITDGLKTMPIDKLLLGTDSKTKTLTKKQQDFARLVAEGTPKAEAYRNTYNTNGNKAVEASEGSRLSMTPAVSAMIDQLKVSIEATKYLLPVHLRSLIVQKLTEKALDDSIKTSDQLRAIELLGKLTDVSAFTERKEIVKHSDSTEARAKLINAITNAIKTTKTLSDDKRMSAESLLDEIANHSNGAIIDVEDSECLVNESDAAKNEIPAAPHTPQDQNEALSMGHGMHTISDKELEKDSPPPTEIVDEEDKWWETEVPPIDSETK
jgi:hypothetical protein